MIHHLAQVEVEANKSAKIVSFVTVVIYQLLFLSLVAYGAPKLGDRNQDIQYAQDMIQKGQVLLKKKQYRKAISYFKRSHARVPDTKNLFTLGAIYSKLDDCPQALTYWSEAQNMCGRCSLASKLDQVIMKHTQTCSSEISIQSLPRAIVSIEK